MYKHSDVLWLSLPFSPIGPTGPVSRGCPILPVMFKKRYMYSVYAQVIVCITIKQLI